MTPALMMDDAAALLNDTVQSVFTDTVLIPYYNIALQELQETFELYSIPVTHEVSAVLNVPFNTSRIAFTLTVPVLPPNLIEIKQLWESPEGLNQWTPMTRKDFLPHYLENTTTISQFIIWAWLSQEIKLVAANADNDLKIDYVKSIFDRLVIGNINLDNPVRNVEGYLTNRMAAFAAYFIGENEERFAALTSIAEQSLGRSLGISIKAQQSIASRRLPFRSSYKRRAVY